MKNQAKITRKLIAKNLNLFWLSTATNTQNLHYPYFIISFLLHFYQIHVLYMARVNQIKRGVRFRQGCNIGIFPYMFCQPLYYNVCVNLPLTKSCVCPRQYQSLDKIEVGTVDIYSTMDTG